MAVFSYRTTARLPRKQIEEEIVRKAQPVQEGRDWPRRGLRASHQWVEDKHLPVSRAPRSAKSSMIAGSPRFRPALPLSSFLVSLIAKRAPGLRALSRRSSRKKFHSSIFQSRPSA